MPKTVTVNWDALDRTHPVLLKVTDERTATLEYRRASASVAGDDPQDRTDRARRQIARWAVDGGAQALPVVIYDLTKPEPSAVMVICTDEADFVKDLRATDDERAQVDAEFKLWLAKRGTKRVHSPEPARMEKASANHTREPLPAPEPPVLRLPTPEPTPEPAAPAERPAVPAALADVPSLFDGMEKLLDKGKRNQDARMGIRGALNKKFGMHLAPDEAEVRLRDDLAVIARGWSGSKVVSVANDKGGAGKTPVALMLSAAMARLVALLVAMLDNNESAGLAKDRVDVQGDHSYTAKHLAQFVAGQPYIVPSELVAFTHRHAEDRYHLIASHHPTLVDAPMTKAQVAEVYRALAKVYSLVVTDSGNTLVADNWLTMIQHTDQLVVPMVTAADRYERARSMLATLDGFGGQYADLARNSVVVVSQWRKGDGKIAKEYAELFQGKVREVVVIPYDEHMGSHDLRFDSLAPATQAAFIHLAAAVARGLQGADEA